MSFFRSLIGQTFGKLLEIQRCAQASLYNEITARTRVMFKKPYGGRRRVPHLLVKPEPYKYRYIVQYPKDGEYTEKFLKVRELAGRHPETGKRVIRKAGKYALRRNYLWIDNKFNAPPGEVVEEKVYTVRHNPFFNTLSALVARNGYKRWIVASENCKPGDIIRTINKIPQNPANVREGEVWPVGALAPGTKIHNVEVYPGEGARHAINAGTSCTVVRKIGKMVILKKPNGDDISINEKCMAAIGRASNPDHYTVNLVYPQRMRWKGGHPQLGTRRRKDGYCGRKYHPPVPLKVYDIENQVKPREPEIIRLDRVY